MTERPSSVAFFASLVFVAVPAVAVSTVASLAELTSLTRASGATYLLVSALALALSAVVSRWLSDAPLATLLRRALLVATLAAAPLLIERATSEGAHAIAWAVCAGLGALAGPDLRAFLRARRTLSAASEEPRAGDPRLSRVALALCLGTVVAPAALPPYVGAARTLMLAGLLLLPWVVAAVATPGAHRRARVLGALTLALGLIAGLGIAGAERWTWPVPRALTPRKRVEPTLRIAGGAWLWSRVGAEGAVLRVHGRDDIVHYEAADDVRFAEAAVHPAATLRPVRRALVVGNESGSVARELLKYDTVEHVLHVSLVPGLTRAFLEHPHLRRAHAGALSDQRVVRLELARAADLPTRLAHERPFDLIVVAAQGPLASVKWLLDAPGRAFLEARIHPQGLAVRRLPSLSEPTFPWCFVEEMIVAGWQTLGYRLTLAGTTFEHALLELASRAELEPDAIRGLRVPTRYLTEAHLGALRRFGRDEAYRRVEQPERCVDELGVTE